MLISIAMMLMMGMFMGWICKKNSFAKPDRNDFNWNYSGKIF